MPQSKGSVNWLTNERQAPNKRCFGIDQKRYKLATKGVKGSTPLTKGFSSVHIDLGDDEHFRVKQKIRSKSAAPKAPEEPVRVKKVTTRAGLRRPRTAFMPARSNIEIRRAVRSEFTEAADIKQRRPKTSNGIEDGNGFSDPEDDLGARSFQELRNVSQIDKLLSAEKQAQREAYERLMSEKRRREADVLHQRLRRFYQRLDEFKKKSNKHNFNSFL
ncbi:hypothetical protein CAPTEDRAFT_188076 [Capitella teleta]|uniref:Uncharacterized protein n=1 Tax=Capitella teleta TaxID=283909 RepID=R7ULU2_CAPTE|nr:hypothetical protein CAPTEDRAFT_188076 [Capitella teleta]|eukprot:ELU04907.1 hypothetical protein CAPTEDRAFT_188076 [Capitella teleta]